VTTTPQVESGRAQRPNVSTHGQGPDGGMAIPDREAGGCAVRVRGGAECGTPHGCGVCGGKVRRWEDIWTDRGFSAEAAEFLRGRGAG